MHSTPSPSAAPPAPFRIRAIRQFIAFRIFFNSRFYYPVFTVMFLDFGLTLEQFALLNAVWAATIVLFEVPSGALADIVGRRNLLVAAGAMMVLEIGLLCVVPRRHAGLLFGVFLLNRVLSGLAEAAASGADEALAYDALQREGDPTQWGRVLERVMRYRSLAFICAAVVGAAVYDPELVGAAARRLGWPGTITPAMTLRLPLILTFIMAVATLVTTLGMKETAPASRPEVPVGGAAVREAFRVTLQAGRWIWRTPLAVAIILSGLLIDHVARMAITLASEYYRLIGLPEASFGLIGAALAVSGLFIPRIALALSDRRPPAFNLLVVVVMTLAGLAGMTRFWPLVGLLPALVLFSAMSMAGFFVSHYLNRITASDRRATVLSFKGLMFNLAYGAVGLLYSLLVALLRRRPELAAESPQGEVFQAAFGWFPAYFVGVMILLALVTAVKLRAGGNHRHGRP